MPHALLLADWSEILGPIAVLVFVVLRYLITEMAGGKKNKPAAPRPAQQPAPQPANGGQQPNEDLRSEVEEFLRRARSGQSMMQEEPDSRRALREEEEDPDPAVPVIIEAAEPEPAPAPLARPKRLEPSPHRGATVGEHVELHVGHLAESQLAENAAHLGEEVGLADEKLEARLKSKFDHQLGKLRQRQTEPDPPAEPPRPDAPSADNLAALLATPGGVRNAIVLNEILRRPTERWD